MYLYGASGHAKVIIEIIELLGLTLYGIYDDDPDKDELLGYRVLGSLTNKNNKDKFIISIGSNKIRKSITTRFDLNYGLLLHPKSCVSKRAKIDVGTVVMGNAVVNSDTRIGKHVIINTSASIDHDCIIEDYVHISPNSTLSGGVYVGEGTHIGSGAVVAPNISIGKWATVGAGAVIIRDVPDFAIVVGNPGKIIKYNDKS